MIALFVAVQAAFAQTGDTGGITVPGPTGETGDTGTSTPSYPTGDTGVVCLDCVGAADLAGDPGGTPCDEGCSSSGSVIPVALVLPALAVTRRRGQFSSRPVATTKRTSV